MEDIQPADMKVLIINKTDVAGGAAIAAKRLVKALQKQGEGEYRFLVQESGDPESTAVPTTQSKTGKKINFARLALEKACFWPYEHSPAIRFQFSLANTGEKINQHPLVQWADVIHLHWLYQGFLKRSEMKKLLELGKPVVWTLHDFWPFTGGCHYPGNCDHFRLACGDCPFLKKPGKNDLSHRILAHKEKMYRTNPPALVGCSRWIAGMAKESSLGKNLRVDSIPNPIDTTVFKPVDRDQLRKKMDLPENALVILFGAARMDDPRKGLRYLVEALQLFHEKFPSQASNIVLMTFGHTAGLPDLPYRVNHRRVVSGDQAVAALYQTSDLFILPSLEDNLPNTVMESMACGTPVVAFDTGGVPEMVEHLRTGFLAVPRDPASLCEGIHQILIQQENSTMRKQCRMKTEQDYSEAVVAAKYDQLYKDLLNQQHSK